MSSDTIFVSMEVPKNLINLTREVRKSLNRTLVKSGNKIKDELRATFRNSQVNTFGKLSRQVTKHRIKTFFTEKYVDVEVVGDRAMVSTFLEHGTGPATGGGANFGEISSWFEKKGIALGRSPKERRAILFAIWKNISDRGISAKNHFGLTQKRIEPEIQQMFRNDLDKFISRMNDFNTDNGGGDTDGTGD